MEVDTEPQRIPELWFKDGNIVLQAGNTQFRVYGGILAARSPIFEDMLSLPQPPGESELVEGCPLVRLHDDPVEATVFLRAIFDLEYFKPFPAQTTYDIIRGCLRLSNKYGVDQLRVRALVHLSSRYRTNLADWDGANFYESSDPDSPKNRFVSEIVSWPYLSTLAQQISVIQLAQEVEATWILPYAFYRLSAVLDGNLEELICEADKFEINLSPEDLKRCLAGQHLQCRASTTDIIAAFASHPHEIHGCASISQCRKARLVAIETLQGMIPAFPCMPLGLWHDDDWESLEDMCPVCLASMQDRHQAAPQRFWNKLPEIYRLPDWEELEKNREAVLGSRWWLA
ncbi:hypothetical protein FB45DRAFT_1065545 [Roridomyces roridus]|uniref:BTB domain-containing protein n=1 Tax=Roridomyces roridus TaxID=1738132 RepID=A0AAD7B6K7_9AGAR|nr:hypothetical protein FB45DRAFT_1065545 [Roridomyces roridus]